MYEVSNRERIFGISVLIVVAILIVVELLLPRYFQKKYRDHPSLWVRPEPLEMTSIAPCKTNLLIAGYSIGVPWAGMPQFHHFTNGIAGGIYSFKNKHKLIIMIFNPRESDYSFDLVDEIQSASPRDFVAFMSSREIKDTTQLLDLKTELYPHPYNAIFEFNSREFRGFQMGDPARDAQIFLNIFDPDGTSLQFFIPVTPEADSPLTQAEINTLIQSLKKQKK